MNLVLVAVGSALGGTLRYLLAGAIEPWSQRFPAGTLLVNVLGSFVIGVFAAASIGPGRLALSPGLRVFVMVGLCGGFTTFSSFSLQTFELLQAGAPLRALGNVVLSVALCLAAVAIGYLLTTRMGTGAA